MFEQHLETGLILRNLADCVLLHGTSTIISKVTSGIVEHTLRALFLSEGTYYLALLNETDDTLAWPFKIKAALIEGDEA